MNRSPRSVSFVSAMLLVCVAALINLAVLFIWGEGVAPATNGRVKSGKSRYQFVNTGPVTAFRLDTQTGEVLLFLLDREKGRLEVFSTTETKQQTLPPQESTAYQDGPFKPSDNVDYVALGIDPATGRIADYNRFNRALIERGMEPVAKP